MDWPSWIASIWPELCEGRRFVLPAELAAPERVGFARVIAEPIGQIDDLALSLRDGSRLHVQRWPNGMRIVHRDRLDPRRGLVTATIHWLTEAPTGRAVVQAVAPRVIRALLEALD